MCSVSAVMDMGAASPPWHQQQALQQPFTQFSPNPLPDLEAREAIKKFIELVEAAKRYDAATRAPDCEDPKKLEFMEQVLERLTAIEKRLGIQS